MFEDLIKAAVLGTVQGLTEFLPVSSTGHLILASEMLGVDDEKYGLAFDASLHVGTLAALLWYFRTTWVDLVAGGLGTLRDRSLADPHGRLAWLILLGTIPAAVFGLLFEDVIEDAFRSPALVATMLIAFSGVFVLAERVSKQTRDIDDVRWFDSIFIGFAQAIALVPGTSRSGATICAGLFRNIERADAARFAFLLSAPIIAGAAGKQMVTVVGDFADGTLGREDAAFFLVGMVTAGIVGYLAIAFLLRYLTTNTLMPFVIYRVSLGLLIFAVLSVQAIT